MVQEAICRAPADLYRITRRRGTLVIFCVFISNNLYLSLSALQTYLAFKELLVRPDDADEPVLELDFAPFNRGFPRLTETRSIGQGVIFLNRAIGWCVIYPIWLGCNQTAAFFKRA